MYRAGQIVPEIETYSLENALEAYRKLESGQLSGRAVVVPHGEEESSPAIRPWPDRI